MKTLVSFSGGTNSTHGLYRLLKETDDEIIAVRFHEPASNSHEEDLAADQRAQKIVDWLKSNVRDFQYEHFTPKVKYTRDPRPVRPGFRWTVDYGVIERRFRAMREAIEHFKPDRFAHGHSMENTSTDRFKTHQHILHVDGCDVLLTSAPRLDPLPLPGQYDYEQLAGTLSGRFQQRAELPGVLRDMIPNCPRAGQADHVLNHTPLCWTCCATALETAKPHVTPAQLDDFFATSGAYGSYRKLANPDSTGWRGSGAALALQLLGLEIRHKT